MERGFKEAFAGLNDQQRLAVKTIDGPLLVIAGPGTGKTQLISTRVGYILQNTDTPADAILLLTFTEAGVQAMRDRLMSLIGKASYDVHLSTYHAFGGEIFRRYPEYFEGAELTLIEDLGSDSLLREIIAGLPYSNPLKFADNYINDLKTFISESKRALLSPDDLAKIAKENLRFIKSSNKTWQTTLNKLTTVGKKTVPVFDELLTGLSAAETGELPQSVIALARYAQGELEQAIEHFNQNGKTTLLTEWKRHWLAKDNDGNYIFDGQRVNERLSAAAGIFRQYQKALRERRLYDYDDMILRAIETLEANPDLKYSLAERYGYIMLDEFQDTNPAQFRLVQLLTDHPVHEGRPNILAVGDDDQAIYAFQGADHANMANFVSHYKGVKIISLTQNYRSWPEIIETAKNISAQVQSRLLNQFKNVKKDLVAVKTDLPDPPLIMARQFKSDAAQNDWIAQEVKNLIDSDVPPAEIAVLAPKHRYLLPLLPYFAQQNIPITYERRENILDEPLVRQLEQMSKLAVAIADGDERLSNYLWAEVLSYDFWRVPAEKIWQISWQSKQSREPWTSILLSDEQLKDVASFFIRLGAQLELSTLEQQLDALIGRETASGGLILPMKSPLYDYYFARQKTESDPLEFSRLISHLNILRSRLRDWRQNTAELIGLRALVNFIEGHRAANINILNSSPYSQGSEAVNILTAYGSKGREFQAVFIVAAVDEVWGSASRNQGYRLSLPANLSYMRYQGASEDERLRLLYVSSTRARTQLFFTSYTNDLAGKPATPLKYMNISQKDDGLYAQILPKKFQGVITDESESISLIAASNYWTDRHTPPFKASLREILEERLKNYQISATDLNHFVNIINYGPEAFFMKCLLLFPGAPTVTDSFGTAIHNTLKFAGRILISDGKLPGQSQLMEIFRAQLDRIELPPGEFDNLLRRGGDSIKAWLAQSAGDLKPSDKFEYDFQNEGSRIGDVRLNGILDRISIDEKRLKITIIDYKTGRAYQRWQPGVAKLHLFQQQLIFYKLLVEGSRRFRKYQVEKGVIEFVEPDENGRVHRLELFYDSDQVKNTVKLITAVWSSIQSLKFPDISPYPATVAGIKKFESDLIAPSAK